MGQPDLTKLIKERKQIVPTMTKIASSQEVLVERQSYKYCQSVHLKTPRIISFSENSLSLELLSGLSGYRVLELLSDLAEVDLLKSYLDFWCQWVVSWQAGAGAKFGLGKTLYLDDRKFTEIVSVLKWFDFDLGSQLEQIKPQVFKDFSSQAQFVFRDATPKNYIISQLVEGAGLDQIKAGLDQVFAFDFTSCQFLTLKEDDFISVLYHYMIPEDVRRSLLLKYNLVENSHQFQLALMIRSGRFWIRRMYYQKHQPELFKKRYLVEQMSFYKEVFFKSLEYLLKYYG